MSRQMIALLSAIALSASSVVYADIEFLERGDDFSNKVVSTLRVETSDTSSATLFLSCNPAEGLSVQLATRSVMHPDDLQGSRMRISTTHKFEEAQEAVTTNWGMNMMQYKNSWYQGNQRAFIEEAAESTQLNLRLNKVGAVYRFSLRNAGDHLQTILRRC